MKLRYEIKSIAKANFLAQYGISVGAAALFILFSNAVVGLGHLLIMPPMTVGYHYFCLKIYKGEKGDIGEMFKAGFSNYARNLGGVLWMYLFIWLWSLLLIIPGIIKAISYSLTPYILADCPDVQSTEALKLSMRMTRGFKSEIFVMGLSFLGWMILSGLTCGILYIFHTGPYISTSFAGLYLELKENALQKGIVSRQELGMA
ncbi:MAG: DUF975 family protein [Christensenellales bacterium]